MRLHGWLSHWAGLAAEIHLSALAACGAFAMLMSAPKHRQHPHLRLAQVGTQGADDSSLWQHGLGCGRSGNAHCLVVLTVSVHAEPAGGRPPCSAGPEGEVAPGVERCAHQQSGPGAPAVVARRGIVQQAAHDAQVTPCAINTHAVGPQHRQWNQDSLT